MRSKRPASFALLLLLLLVLLLLSFVTDTCFFLGCFFFQLLASRQSNERSESELILLRQERDMLDRANKQAIKEKVRRTALLLTHSLNHSHNCIQKTHHVRAVGCGSTATPTKRESNVGTSGNVEIREGTKVNTEILFATIINFLTLLLTLSALIDH